MVFFARAIHYSDRVGHRLFFTCIALQWEQSHNSKEHRTWWDDVLQSQPFCTLFLTSFSFWFVFKSDRPEHSSTSECKIFTLTKLHHPRIRWWYAQSFSHCAFGLRRNNNMHIYSTWFASIFFMLLIYFAIFLVCLMKGEILFIDSHWTPIGNTEK